MTAEHPRFFDALGAMDTGDLTALAVFDAP
jgi:hypothetical protein